MLFLGDGGRECFSLMNKYVFVLIFFAFKFISSPEQKAQVRYKYANGSLATLSKKYISKVS